MENKMQFNRLVHRYINGKGARIEVAIDLAGGCRVGRTMGRIAETAFDYADGLLLYRRREGRAPEYGIYSKYPKKVIMSMLDKCRFELWQTECFSGGRTDPKWEIELYDGEMKVKAIRGNNIVAPYWKNFWVLRESCNEILDTLNVSWENNPSVRHFQKSITEESSIVS